MLNTSLKLPSFQDRGFSLIEIIIIIVILGILIAIALPTYQDMSIDAKRSACRSALGQMRSAISIYYSSSAVVSGTPFWPDIDSLRTIGVVMQSEIPKNPFQNESNAPDSIVTGITKGVVVGTRGGWAYKASTGEIWPNTSTSVGGGGCGGPTDINENEW